MVTTNVKHRGEIMTVCSKMVEDRWITYALLKHFFYPLKQESQIWSSNTLTSSNTSTINTQLVSTYTGSQIFQCI